jgi:NADH-quinone oxidoreductase subunit N
MMQFAPASAEIFLLCAACVILVVDVSLDESRRGITYGLSLLTVAACAWITVAAWQAAGGREMHLFYDMFVADRLAVLLKFFTYLAVMVCMVYSRAYMEVRGLFRGEFFVLTLFCLLGMMVMISANHFIALYLGLELMSLCLYALIALNRDSAPATEAAMKYFVLGALASGLLLYGMSMLYGATGSLEIGKIAAAIATRDVDQTVTVFGLVFVVSGLAFKLGVVPFHMWIPDVYDGSPNAITLLVGSAPKIAAFAMIMRILTVGLAGLAVQWQQMLVLMAVLSLGLGNLAAIAQTNIKRMLAYSTISHMGFVLLGLLAGVLDGSRCCVRDAYSAAMFYLITYVVMVLGAFGIILLMSRAGFEADKLDDFRGLNQRHPWYAFVMLLMMFSLAGIPPTVGFYAKLSVLQAIVQVGHVGLAVYAVLLSLVGAFYYLRVVKLMYFDEPVGAGPLPAPLDMRLVLSLNGIVVLALGIAPAGLMNLCLNAVAALMAGT